jgi:hypothetical protein
LGIVGITSFSFASFHAKHPLKFHVRNHNIVSFWSHICCCCTSVSLWLLGVGVGKGGLQEWNIYRARDRGRTKEEGCVCTLVRILELAISLSNLTISLN